MQGDNLLDGRLEGRHGIGPDAGVPPLVDGPGVLKGRRRASARVTMG